MASLNLIAAVATGLSRNQALPIPKTPNSTSNYKSPSLVLVMVSSSLERRRSVYYHRRQRRCGTVVKASSGSGSGGGGSSTSGSGLYSAQIFQLTAQNVDMVLEDVRPYLIADGGNVDVVSVHDGVISLKLQGACGSCPSSTTTMKMGIERVLKEKFGDAVKDIRQVDVDPISETTVEVVNGHLDILRPAIKNYGGSVEVLSVGGGDCLVKYIGPESIGSGIKAAIKEKFPDITNVVLSD